MRGGPSWRAVATNQVEAEEGAGGAERKAFVPPQGFLSPPPPCALAQPTLPSLSWSVERGEMQRCDGTGSVYGGRGERLTRGGHDAEAP